MSINNNLNTINKVEYNGTTFNIIGTNHVDEDSRNLVLSKIESENYDAIAVELCEQRLESLTNPNFKKPSLFKTLNKVGVKGFIFGYCLSKFYNILKNKHDFDVGGELIGAVKKAKEKNIPYELIDQDINYTRLRVGIKSSYFFILLAAFGFFITSMIIYFMDKNDVVDLIKNKIKQDKQEEKFGAFKAIRDERDLYMANNLKNMTKYKNVLVVVGAAHVEGMIKHMKT